MLDQNLLKDEDEEILMLKADASNAIEKLIVQPEIAKKPRARQMSKNISLISLPLELFLIVSTHLDVKDVENLGVNNFIPVEGQEEYMKWKDKVVYQGTS